MLSHWMALLLFYLTLVGLHQSASAVNCPVERRFLKINQSEELPYICEWSINKALGSNQKLAICHPCIASINCTDDFCELIPSTDQDCDARGHQRICGIFNKPGIDCKVDPPRNAKGLCNHNQIPRRIKMRINMEYDKDMFTERLNCTEGLEDILPICNGTVALSTPQPVEDEGASLSPSTTSSEDGEATSVSTTMTYPVQNSTGQEATTQFISSDKASFPTYAVVIIIVVVLLIVIALAVIFYQRRRRNTSSSAPNGFHHAGARI